MPTTDRADHLGAMWAVGLGVALVIAAIIAAFFPDTVGLGLVFAFATIGTLMFALGLLVLGFAAVSALVSVIVAPGTWAIRHEADHATSSGLARTSADRRVDEGTEEARERDGRRMDDNQSAS